MMLKIVLWLLIYYIISTFIILYNVGKMFKSEKYMRRHNIIVASYIIKDDPEMLSEHVAGRNVINDVLSEIKYIGNYEEDMCQAMVLSSFVPFKRISMLGILIMVKSDKGCFDVKNLEWCLKKEKVVDNINYMW